MSLCNSVVLNVELTPLSWLYGLKIHQLRAESTVLLCHVLFKTAMIVFYITYTSYYIYMHELFFFQYYNCIYINHFRMKLIISKIGEIYTDRKISVPNHLKISSVYYRMAEFNGIDFLRIITRHSL